MERLEVKDIHELAVKIDEWFKDFNIGDYPAIGVVGFYDDVKVLMKELVLLGHDIEAAELEYPELDCYTKEFLLYLTADGISVEKAWNKSAERYYYTDGDIIIVIDNCSSAVLKSINGDIEVEVGIADRDEDADIPAQDEGNVHEVHTKACIIDRDDGDNDLEAKTGKEKVFEDMVKRIDPDEGDEMYIFSFSHYYGDDGYKTYSFSSSNKFTPPDIEKMVGLLY